MALGDREHVEAVAIIRNLLCALGPREELDGYARECATAGDVWLRENHPPAEVYVAALKDSHALTEERPCPQCRGDGRLDLNAGWHGPPGVERHHWHPCPTCDGTGVAAREERQS